MTVISFADVVHQSISFNSEIESENLVLELLQSPWVQRLRDISQTANTKLVYPFSEHSRFGHSLGVAYLANQLMNHLQHKFANQVQTYRNAVSAAAILHDIGHLAPGSHISFKTWFPGKTDQHELITTRIIREDRALRVILDKFGSNLAETVCQILEESNKLPPWSWEIISGGGWNVDRGNWCMVDSILAGVSYGKYNIPALTESIVITDSGHLALLENRLDAMMHFTISRHSMYRQVYQHRVLRAADVINRAIVQRARDLPTLVFADQQMQNVLKANSHEDLNLDTIFWMRESWWLYHLAQWSQSNDPILKDLCQRLLHRRLFKTVRLPANENKDNFVKLAAQAVQEAGFDPRYYLHEVSTSDMQAADYQQSMSVLMDDGRILRLAEAEPLFAALARESNLTKRIWYAMPMEAKQKFGRVR